MSEKRENNNKKNVIHIDISGEDNGKKATAAELQEGLLRISDMLQGQRDRMLSALSEYLEEIEGIELSAFSEEDQALIEEIRKTVKTAGKGKTDREIMQDVMALVKIERPPLPDVHNYGIMNDKAALTLVSKEPLSKEVNGQLSFQWAVNQARPKAKQVVSYFSLTYEGEDCKISRTMTAFDEAVLNAICTRLHYWKKEYPGESMPISPQEIWRTMNGQTDNARVSAAQSNRVVKSLEKMRFTRFCMDISEELKSEFITIDDDRVTDGYIETYMLNADRIKLVSEKGRTFDGYRIKAEPMIYTYNKLKGHILYFDYALLDTSTVSTRNSENVIEFKNYLLQRILLMQQGKLNNNHIKFTSLYEATGIMPPEERVNRDSFTTENSYKTKIRQEAKKDREKIYAILDVWRDMDFISGYDPIKEKKSITGIAIKWESPQKYVQLPEL